MIPALSLTKNVIFEPHLVARAKLKGQDEFLIARHIARHIVDMTF
jgi:4'-phosphopantetheinyl transferase EntD